MTANRTWVLPDSNGTAGYVLSTNGSGNLSWVAQTGGGGGSSQARIQFTAGSSGTGQTFTDSGISSFTNNTFANVFVNGVLLQTSEYSISGTTLTVSRYLSTGDNVIIAATSPGSVSGTLATTSGGTGLNTYTTGDTVYASATNTLAKLPIGTSGQVLTVSGGLPSWQTPSSGAKQYLFATGSNANITTVRDLIFGTQIAASGISYNTSTGVATLTANRTYRIFAGNGSWQVPAQTSGTVNIGFNVVNSTTNAELVISTNGIMGGDQNGGAPSSVIAGSGSVEIIYTPTTNETIKIRVINVNATFTWNDGAFSIQEL